MALAQFLCELSERSAWITRFEERVVSKRPNVPAVRVITAAALRYANWRELAPEAAAEAYLSEKAR